MENERKKAEAEERKREKEGSAFEICVQKLFPPTLSARNSNLQIDCPRIYSPAVFLPAHLSLLMLLLL